MQNLLNLLIELANTTCEVKRNALIEKQPLDIQMAFLSQDVSFIKQKLSKDTPIFFNERSVVCIQD